MRRTATRRNRQRHAGQGRRHGENGGTRPEAHRQRAGRNAGGGQQHEQAAPASADGWQAEQPSTTTDPGGQRRRWAAHDETAETAAR